SEENWPYLFAHGAETSAAGTLASMFRSKVVRPRFRFSPGEQQMLLLALEGRSDDDLADALGISAWTVKKRWQSVYAKVEAIDPSVVAPHEDEKLRQRRRFLLAYLREHLEELRPFRNR
ncbi:MAG: helix-turn-helix transcriptional regulator, partial [Polyangiaceae bacterium]